MKIAIAKERNEVCAHFGHCEGFEIFKVEDNKIKESNFVKNPGHKPGFLPNYLNELDVKVVIAGGMGGGAIQIFNEHGIKIVTGVEGDVNTVIEKYINNELKTSDNTCHHG